MSERFDARRAADLETDERRDAVRPEELLLAAGAGPGMVCGDLGSGTGFFARPLSRLVGPAGVVYSVDENPEMVEFQRQRLLAEGYANVRLLVAPVECVPLPAAALDLCICCFVLHEVEQRTALLGEMVRLLKTGGRALLVDWQAIEPPPGPSLASRVPMSLAVSEAEAADLCLERAIERPQHYALILHRA